MIEIEPALYETYVPWAKRCSSNRVYPLSVAEGIQSGSVYADSGAPECVLFWHSCGFAYLSGIASSEFLEEIASDICFRYGRRMVLITDDVSTADSLVRKGYAEGKRLEYAYAGDSATGEAPNVEITRICAENIRSISGRIVPSFSWEEDRFLKSGFGFAAFDGGTYCGCAFSAAASSDEVDIGVEVVPEYRGRGIAYALVLRMCAEIAEQGKKPVWAHSVVNTGSMHTALKCGFRPVKTNSCFILKTSDETNGITADGNI